MHPGLKQVTERIRERSRPARDVYLQRLEQAASQGPQRHKLGCGNLAHAQAACNLHDKTLMGTSQ